MLYNLSERNMPAVILFRSLWRLRGRNIRFPFTGDDAILPDGSSIYCSARMEHGLSNRLEGHMIQMTHIALCGRTMKESGSITLHILSFIPPPLPGMQALICVS